MFKKFNTLLRCLQLDGQSRTRASRSEPAHMLLQQAEKVGLAAWEDRPGGSLELRWRNRYVGTIYLINETAVKLGMLTAAGPIYRGIGSGAALSEQWVHPDEFGLRGGIEASLLSVTKKREVALNFANNSGDGGSVFELVMGAAGRGADLSALELTYIPSENELLFPATTALELTRERVEQGNVLVYSCNVIAPPVE